MKPLTEKDFTTTFKKETIKKTIEWYDSLSYEEKGFVENIRYCDQIKRAISNERKN